MLLLPTIGRRSKCGTVFCPHLVDEGVPSLTLSRPRLVVISAGCFADGLDKSGVIFVHPAVDIVEESVVIPG